MRIAALLVPAVLAAEIPAEDVRNTSTPDTNTHFTMPAYRSLAEWQQRKARLRAQILTAAGLDPMPERVPLNAQVFGRIERDGYTVEKVLIQTLPGYWLGGNLFRPRGVQGKVPGIASPHGHWKRGRLENTDLGSIPGRGINLARQGHVVLNYDMVGYNDTKQTPHAFGGPAEQLWSFGPLGLQLWNSIRVLDFLESLPEVDRNRIAATGASGGGTQTFLLSAVDERVRVAAPVNMISAIMQGGSPCENAPGLRHGAFNVEFGAMMAPRPLLMVSATGDWTKNTPKEEFPAVRSIYERHGKPNEVEQVQFDAPHNYNRDSRQAVYHFFARRLLGRDGDEFNEREFTVESDSDMLALSGRDLPAGAVTYEQLFDWWKANARRQSEKTSLNELRSRLRQVFHAEWPTPVASKINGEAIVLGREGRGDRIPGLWMPGRSGRPLLLVHPDGSATARETDAAKKAIAAGRPLLIIDAFQTGSARAPRDRSQRHFLAFNLTDDANRVQDILTALAFLKSRFKGRVDLVGLDRAAVWALFAASIAGSDIAVTADVSGFPDTDAGFAEQFFVPGVQRAGGLAAARRLTTRMR